MKRPGSTICPECRPPTKKTILANTSYRDFLLHIVKADPGVIPFYQARTHGEWGVGIDAVSALDVWAFKFPGFQGLDLEPGSAPHTPDTRPPVTPKPAAPIPFIFLTATRRSPGCWCAISFQKLCRARSAEDVVTARIDYARLDRLEAPVRVRLGGTVVRARNLGDTGAFDKAEVTYFRGGEAYTVRTGACVLACWNMMIPFLCPDLPEKQKEALRYPVKVPLDLYERGATQLESIQGAWRLVGSCARDRISRRCR